MKRLYYPFYEWEDFKNGMYNKVMKSKESYYIDLSIRLLSNRKEFLDTMILILEHWPISVNENLSNVSCNRRAWLGQSACNYRYSSPEYLTRLAWGQMSQVSRYHANKEADKIIRVYEKQNNKVHIQLGTKMLY